MPAVGDEVELDLRPGLLELPRGDRRGAAVVPALDDHAGDSAQLLGGALEQLTFLKPALIAHVVVLDAGDGDGDFGRREMLDRRRARKQGDDVALPLAPRLGGAEPDVWIVAGQPLAIGLDQVAAL